MPASILQQKCKFHIQEKKTTYKCVPNEELHKTFKAQEVAQ